MNTGSDEILMQQVREGDLDQLSALFERYSGMLYCYFMKRLQDHSQCEDLTQEVFLRVLKYRKTFKPSNTFKSWLFTIARNTQRKQWGKRFSKLHILSDDHEHLDYSAFSDPSPRPDQSTTISDETQLLYQALYRLPDEKRQLVVMKRIQELSYAQIAETLDCEVKPLKVRVCRAIAELGKHLKSIKEERDYEMPRMQ